MSWAQVFANTGGQKAYRLAQAVRSGQGIVKVSKDGALVWLFSAPPQTLLTDDGFILDAEEFLNAAAKLLQIEPEDVYRLTDEKIRFLARKIAGIEPQAPIVAKGDTDADV